jgi:hypothetical protein
MTSAAARLVPIALLILAPAASLGAPPRPVPPVYATHNYVLTFRTPPGATHCPLPAGWIGSDHGTTVFLERPRDCGAGAGYPSTSRSFAPGNVARINLFYVYRPIDPMPPVRCRRVGRLVLLGRARPLCRTDEAGMIRLSAEAPYRADIAAEATMTLVTRPARLATDLATFRRVAASLRTCRATWRGRRGRVSYGSGRPCGRAGTF